MDESVFENIPRLRTHRVDFRPIAAGDADLLYRFNSDPLALKYVPRAPFTSISQAEEKLTECLDGFEKRTCIWWVLSLKDTGERIGYTGLFGIDRPHNNAEIGYGLLPPWWGRGYATEAVSEIVGFGFDTLGLHRIYGQVVPGNTASEKILERLGFAREGVLTDAQFARGRYFHLALYARINSAPPG